ncbi:hypothetical protein ILUMI_05071, partial [Ignelater luminosus]
FNLQAYKFASNEYRLFPFQMNINYCKEQEHSVFGFDDVVKHTNCTLKCPFKRGFYYVDKYRPDETKWPPHLVPGDFKLAITVTYQNQEAAQLAWYGSVIKIERLWNF